MLKINRPPLNRSQQVESPNEARVYSTGEVIVINVVFNQEVVLDGDPTLLLETGVFNQKVSYRQNFTSSLRIS